MDPQSLKRDWDRDGCLILRNYLNTDEVAELDLHTREYLSASPKTEQMKTAKPFQGVIKNLNATDSWFQDLLDNGKQTQLIRELVEDDLYPATAAYFDRIVGEENGIAPHFDAVGHRRVGATIWFALDKADKQNGCLYYDRGSHNQNYSHEIGIKNFDKSSVSVIPIELEPGDAAIHDSRTVHWSEPNQSNRSRRAVSLFYWAKNSIGEKRAGFLKQKS